MSDRKEAIELLGKILEIRWEAQPLDTKRGYCFMIKADDRDLILGATDQALAALSKPADEPDKISEYEMFTESREKTIRKIREVRSNLADQRERIYFEKDIKMLNQVIAEISKPCEVCKSWIDGKCITNVPCDVIHSAFIPRKPAETCKTYETCKNRENCNGKGMIDRPTWDVSAPNDGKDIPCPSYKPAPTGEAGKFAEEFRESLLERGKILEDNEIPEDVYQAHLSFIIANAFEAADYIDRLEAEKKRLLKCESDLRKIHEEYMTAIKEANKCFQYIDGELMLLTKPFKGRKVNDDARKKI